MGTVWFTPRNRPYGAERKLIPPNINRLRNKVHIILYDDFTHRPTFGNAVDMFQDSSTKEICRCGGEFWFSAC